jgi:HK97 family phage portal protein
VSRGSDAGIVISDDRAMQVSAVWSCVRLIAETVASLPLGLYRERGGVRSPLEKSHALVDLFKRRPNPMMTPHEFREALTTQLALWGNGYAVIEWSNDRPVALIPLRPESVTPMRLGSELTYHVVTDRGVAVYAKKSILHLKGFGASGTVGFSPISYARESLGLTVSADKYAAASFRNGGRPGGVLQVDKFLDDKQRELMRKLYSGLSATADNAGQLWVLEGGITYQPLDIPPDDMQMLQSRQFQLAEIARFFRVPSYLINDTEKATSWGSGIEQMNLGFLQYTLQPYLTRWESTLSDALLGPVDRSEVVIEHKVEGLLRADSKGRSEFYAAMVGNGLMTRNEVRRKENLPQMPSADQLTAQVNLAPLSMLGQQSQTKSGPADITVKCDAPVVNVRVDPVTVHAPPANVVAEEDSGDRGQDGELVREVLALDASGAPVKIVEKRMRRHQIREITEWDGHGVPTKAIVRSATDEEMAACDTK